MIRHQVVVSPERSFCNGDLCSDGNDVGSILSLVLEKDQHQSESGQEQTSAEEDFSKKYLKLYAFHIVRMFTDERLVEIARQTETSRLGTATSDVPRL